MRSWIILVLLLGSIGCANTQLTLKRSPDSQANQIMDVRMHAFLFGAIPLKSLSDQEIQRCPADQMTNLKVQMTSWDVVFTVATAFLYTPHHLAITCTKLDSTFAPKP